MGTEVFIPITLFAAIAFIIFYYLRYRYLERQSIIEKGLSGEDLKNMLGKPPRRESNGTNMAKWGIIAIAIGLAILIGTQFEEEVTFGLIFLFPGIGLLIFYQFFAKPKHSQHE